MATPLEESALDSEKRGEKFPNKRYVAKYKCKAMPHIAKYKCKAMPCRCQEKCTWKTRNTRSRFTQMKKMSCNTQDCRFKLDLVRSYKFEVFSTVVVYQCKSCGNKIKKKKLLSKVLNGEIEERKEVPFCTICQKDNMKVLIWKHLWKRERMFGRYKCADPDCNNEWRSGYAWEGVWQKCHLCGIPVLPEHLEPLQKGKDSSNNARSREPHQTDLCGMCTVLGYCCRGFKVASKDVATVDEIPPEEDEQLSVITTNSSIFGDHADHNDDYDDDDDDDNDDDDGNGGGRTPVNMSDVEVDDELGSVEEKFSKLKLKHPKK